MESAGLVRTYSMDIINDPRFFTDNVINYRLAAFGCLAVVSGLMVQNCMDQLFGMSKSMDPWKNGKSIDWDGVLQMIAFILLLGILFIQMLATYISVAQPYHTYRLMTAGQTGFEAACAYYLNVNISVWRHFIITQSLNCLPVYVFQMGLRLIVKFDRGTVAEPDLPSETPSNAKLQGWIFNGAMICMALAIFSVHFHHFAIFNEKYRMLHLMPTAGPGLVGYMMQLMAPRAAQTNSQFVRSDHRTGLQHDSPLDV